MSGSPAGPEPTRLERPASPASRRGVPTAINSVAAAFNGPPRTSVPAPQTPPPEAPLDASAIQALQDRIRALQPPQLAAFTQAFRQAFQMPEAIPAIAGLISAQRHGDWIQQYLGQAVARPQESVA